MKKNLLSAALCLLCAVPAFAQETTNAGTSKTYLRVGVGYTFPFGTANNFDGVTVSGSTGYAANYTTTERSKFSFGSGVNATGAFGYMLNDYIGLELGLNISFLNPKKTATVNEYLDQYNRYTGSNEYYQKTRFTVIPAVVLQAPLSRVSVYSRVGAVLPVSDKIQVKESGDITEQGTRLIFTREAEMKTRFTVGVQGALGVKLPLPGGAFWVEANMMAMTAYAKSLSVEKFTIDGQDVMPFLDVSDREWEFSTSVTEYNTVTNPDSPSEALTFPVPYSNIGFAAGFTFEL